MYQKLSKCPPATGEPFMPKDFQRAMLNQIIENMQRGVRSIMFIPRKHGQSYLRDRLTSYDLKK